MPSASSRPPRRNTHCFSNAAPNKKPTRVNATAPTAQLTKPLSSPPSACRVNTRLVECVLLFVAIVWGINPVAIKIGMQYLPPESFNLARMVIASLVALIALALSNRWRRPGCRELLTLLRVTAFGFCLYQIFLIAGLQRTTAGNASFIHCLVPASVALLNRLYGLDRLSRPIVAGIACSLSGVLLIVIGAGEELSLNGPHLLGALLIFAAQTCYAYYMIASKELQTSYAIYQITAGQMSITVLLMLPTAFPDILAVRWHAIPAIAWGCLLFSGILGLCLCNFLWIWGTGILGTARVAIFNNICPVFAVLAGHLVLGEPFGPLQCLGALCIFIGVYVTRRHRPTASPPISPTTLILEKST